jgi:hypothetical protein
LGAARHAVKKRHDSHFRALTGIEFFREILIAFVQRRGCMVLIEPDQCLNLIVARTGFGNLSDDKHGEDGVARRLGPGATRDQFRKGDGVIQQHLEQLDGELIDRGFQPFVDWIGQSLAFDCFRLARVCTDLSAFAWILSQAPDTAVAFGTAPRGYEVFQISLIMVGLGSIAVLRSVFERYGSRRSGARINPLRASMYIHRVSCLLWLTALTVKTTMGPIGFGSLALLAVGGFATIAVYVAACSNRPPRWREHKANFRNWRVAARSR